jgi:hypothetical protein
MNSVSIPAPCEAMTKRSRAIGAHLRGLRRVRHAEEHGTSRIHASCHVVVRRWNSDGVSVANLACNKGKRQTCPTAIDSGALMTQVEIRVNPGFRGSGEHLIMRPEFAPDRLGYGLDGRLQHG